jgi:hypothetical protein
MGWKITEDADSAVAGALVARGTGVRQQDPVPSASEAPGEAPAQLPAAVVFVKALGAVAGAVSAP